ncbi:hypothetical protein CEF21_14105 [Bacillus sp. FJAT-42376]|nr:hypothetical protein CEF21_14105 [Bacillus sp. FJAT-42376]
MTQHDIFEAHLLALENGLEGFLHQDPSEAELEEMLLMPPGRSRRSGRGSRRGSRRSGRGSRRGSRRSGRGSRRGSRRSGRGSRRGSRRSGRGSRRGSRRSGRGSRRGSRRSGRGSQRGTRGMRGSGNSPWVCRSIRRRGFMQ